MAGVLAPLDVNAPRIAPSKEMIRMWQRMQAMNWEFVLRLIEIEMEEEQEAELHRRATLVARAQDYAVPIPRPREPYRRTARNGNGDAVGNKKWFRSWRGTYAVYEDLREPAYYSEHIDVDLVKRRELEHKIRKP